MKKGMKSFIGGVVAGAVMCTALGAAAVTYTAQPASFKVLVNGEEFNSDPPALVVEGRTYLPLRAMGDALGVPVVWNDELGQAEVGEAKAPVTVNNEVQANDKWKMTYKSFKAVKDVDGFTKAGDGKEFVIVSFELENLTTETQTFSSMVYLDSYFDDVKTKQMIIYYTDEQSLLSVSVEPGKKVKGYLSYEVDVNWKKLELVYNDDIFDKSKENAMNFCIMK